MSKHTPGPWAVFNGVDIYPADDDDARFYIAHCDPDNAPLEALGAREHPATYMTYAEVTANARLIATAPELLEALEETHAALTLKVPEYIGSPLYTRNSAAIAKAKGEL